MASVGRGGRGAGRPAREGSRRGPGRARGTGGAERHVSTPAREAAFPPAEATRRQTQPNRSSRLGSRGGQRPPARLRGGPRAPRYPWGSACLRHRHSRPFRIQIVKLKFSFDRFCAATEK
ncbi:unnamed protein product [Coccothraustes coccothraustes]